MSTGGTSDIRDLINAIKKVRRNGKPLFEVTLDGNSHYRVTNLSTGASHTVPYSPHQGNRSFQNTVAGLKRHLGFDYNARRRPQKPKAKNRVKQATSAAVSADAQRHSAS